MLVPKSKAIAIPVQDLQSSPVSVGENIETAIKRVLTELMNQTDQAMKTLTHICRTRKNEDTSISNYREHQYEEPSINKIRCQH